MAIDASLSSLQPVGELLPQNKAGDTELDHIMSVLLRVKENRSSEQEKDSIPIHLGLGRFLVGRTLYLCRLPSKYGRDEAVFSTAIHRLGSVGEVLLAFSKVLESQTLANRHQHIWHTTQRLSPYSLVLACFTFSCEIQPCLAKYCDR